MTAKEQTFITKKITNADIYKEIVDLRKDINKTSIKATRSAWLSGIAMSIVLILLAAMVNAYV